MCDQHTGREHFNYSSNIIKKTSHIGIIDKNPRVHTGELNKYIITVAYHEHHERPSIWEHEQHVEQRWTPGQARVDGH